MISPKSSTWMSSQVLITRLMSCSTSRMPMPSSARPRSTAAMASVSVSFSPDETSSSRIRRGQVGQGPAQLDQAGPAGGQAVDPVLGHVAQPEALDELVGHLLRRAVVGPRPRPGPTGPGPTDLGSRQDVLPHRQQGEDLEALEGAGQAPAGPLVGRQLGDVLTVEHHRAPGHRLQPAQGVEHRGLARPVGADQAGDAAGVDVQVDGVGGHVPAEADGDAPSFEQRHRAPPRPGPAPGRCDPARRR